MYVCCKIHCGCCIIVGCTECVPVACFHASVVKLPAAGKAMRVSSLAGVGDQ